MMSLDFAEPMFSNNVYSCTFNFHVYWRISIFCGRRKGWFLTLRKVAL